MFKALFWFTVSALGTLLFGAVMLFVFGQSNRLVCRHPQPSTTTCSVSHVLLRTVPLPGWQADGVTEAYVQEDCDDGCTYRTALRTDEGTKPINEVWTDQERYNEGIAAEINAFINNGRAPTLVIDDQPQAWVILLLVGLTAMVLVIEAVAFGAQAIRALRG
jgi:hypothetical protein